MAEPQVTFRVPRALLALIDEAADKAGRNRTAEMLDTLHARYIGEDSEPERAPKAAPKPRQPAPPIVTGAQLRERDLAPKLKEAPTAGAAKGGGIVSGLDLPVGNERRPHQKGAAKEKAKR